MFMDFMKQAETKLRDEMQVYFNNQLIGEIVPMTANIEPSTLTMEDIEHSCSLLSKPFEGSFTVDYPKINQFGFVQVFGMRLIEQELIIGHKQVKTHRKKRINKKWRKRYGFYPIYDDNLYVVGNTIIGSPKAIEALVESVERMGKL